MTQLISRSTLVIVSAFIICVGGSVGCRDDVVIEWYHCGDGLCTEGESCANCSSDCGDCPVCIVDDFCDEAYGESINGCCTDCCVSCDLPSMTGASHDFLIKTLFIPDSASAALANGVDLSGDGVIDNKLGSIISLLAQQGMVEDVNVLLNEQLRSGELLLLVRLTRSGDDETLAAVQLLQARVHGDATPTFDGADIVVLDSTFMAESGASFLCGEWEAPALQAGRGDLPIILPLLDMGWVALTMENAIIQTDAQLHAGAAVTTEGISNLVLGGGLSKAQINSQLIPLLVDYIAEVIATGGAASDAIMAQFEVRCDSTICPDADTHPDCADDGIITAKELQCNMLLATALAPDVDIDGDGENDLLSLGLTIVEAVPVTVVVDAAD